MDPIETIKSYYRILDSTEFDQAGDLLSENYQLVDFLAKPMDKTAMLALIRLLKHALPNLKHSLSNFRIEGNVVKVTVQRSGNHTANLDLRSFGIGVVPCTQKFIIFPNMNYEFSFIDGKIATERDVSPNSPNRRMSGLLKSLGVNVAAL